MSTKFQGNPYGQPEGEAIARQREKSLKNYNAWAWHKNLIEVAMQRYLQKPSAQTEDHLMQSLTTYRKGYEAEAFRPPTASLYFADNTPPEGYQFRS